MIRALLCLCLAGFTSPLFAQADAGPFRQAAARTEKSLSSLVDAAGVRTPELQSTLAQWTKVESTDEHPESDYVHARFHLYRSIYLLAAITRNDPLYAPPVKELTDRLERVEKQNYPLANRILNATHRLCEMSCLYAVREGTDNPDVEDVLTRLKYGNSRAKTVQHQIRNGLYRTMEAWTLTARIHGADPKKITAITDRLTREDENSKTVFQQITNGMERTAEMMELAAEAKKTAAPLKPTP